MIAFLPHCDFLSEVSRAIAIAGALRERQVPVSFASRGGRFSHLIPEAGFSLQPLDPPVTEETTRRFFEILTSMDPSGPANFYTDAELREAVRSELEFLRSTEARLAVTGFTLSAYVSTRLADIPLATDHGGSFVPPVLGNNLGPVMVNPPDPRMARLPAAVQRWLFNRLSGLFKGPTKQLEQYAEALGIESPVSSWASMMCGDLTLVTELPEVLGLSEKKLAGWRPRWPYRFARDISFRFTGPLYARLDLPIPPAVDDFLEADDPVVYVSMSSVDEGFLRAVVEVVKKAGYRLLVGATVHDVADLSDNRTLVTGVLPNHLIMPQVDAAVIMGGQGTVQTAVASATPFVGLPLHGEQELNVAVAERLGMAIRMAPSEATTPALTEAIRSLIDDPTHAAGAERAAEHYRNVDGAANAAEAILAWLRERGEALIDVPASRRPEAQLD